jgi:hypothetical protein
MPSKTYIDEFGDDLAELPYRHIRIAGHTRQKKQVRPLKQIAPTDMDSPASIATQSADSLAEIELTYTPSRHERGWILDSLSDFYDQEWFSDILRLVKGGKEASVYLCQTKTALQAPLLAAKVYRPRRFRNLKKDHIYR